MKTAAQIASHVQIRPIEAIWVLAAHFYATVVPLALCLVASHHWSYLEQSIQYPFLIFVAVGLLCAGSAFEVAQNTADRWYLTPETGSANGTGFCDFLFFWFVTAGQAVLALAIDGDALWVQLLAIGAVVICPMLYLLQRAVFLTMGITGVAVAVLGYQAFGDPVIFFQLLLPVVTMYFFGILLKTGAQVMHGLTTAAASSGVWFLVWAIHNGDAGTPVSWTLIAGVTVVTVVAGAVLRPVLIKLPTSPRVVRQVAA
jgi:hypothetical protein